jgi:hypothetical protein
MNDEFIPLGAGLAINIRMQTRDHKPRHSVAHDAETVIARPIWRPVRPIRSVLIPLAAFSSLLLLAGCGGSAAAPPPKTHTTKPAKVAQSVAAQVGVGQIAFGTGSVSGRPTGVSHSFTTPARLTWTAHLTHALSAPAAIRLTFINDTGPGPHPRTAWSGMVQVQPTGTVTGSMTRAVMLSRHITDGAKYIVSYSLAGNAIAMGAFRLQNSSGSITY